MLLKRSVVFRLLGVLLITVFLAKSCDLFIEHCVAHHTTLASEKSCDNGGTTNNESKTSAEDSLDKGSKKLYSCFDFASGFNTGSHTMALSVHWEKYTYGIFTEPLRVVLTPPPNAC